MPASGRIKSTCIPVPTLSCRPDKLTRSHPTRGPLSHVISVSRRSIQFHLDRMPSARLLFFSGLALSQVTAISTQEPTDVASVVEPANFNVTEALLGQGVDVNELPGLSDLSKRSDLGCSITVSTTNTTPRGTAKTSNIHPSAAPSRLSLAMTLSRPETSRHSSTSPPPTGHQIKPR